jgi:hypothetical protein
MILIGMIITFLIRVSNKLILENNYKNLYIKI